MSYNEKQWIYCARNNGYLMIIITNTSISININGEMTT